FPKRTRSFSFCAQTYSTRSLSGRTTARSSQRTRSATRLPYFQRRPVVSLRVSDPRLGLLVLEFLKHLHVYIVDDCLAACCLRIRHCTGISHRTAWVVLNLGLSADIKD